MLLKVIGRLEQQRAERRLQKKAQLQARSKRGQPIMANQLQHLLEKLQNKQKNK